MINSVNEIHPSALNRHIMEKGMKCIFRTFGDINVYHTSLAI